MSTHKGKGKASEPIRQLTMESTGSSSVLQMPAGIKAKGQRKLQDMEEHMLNLASSAGLEWYYIPVRCFP